MNFSSTWFLIGAFLSASTLPAMEPPTPAMLEAYRRDGTLTQRIADAKSIGNHKVSNGLLERVHSKLMKGAMTKGLVSGMILRTPPPASKDMPTTGVVKTLMLCIDFSDYPHNATNEPPAMTARIFGNGDDLVAKPYESYHNFYARSSYGKLDLQGEVLGWYRPNYKRVNMPQTTAAREQLIKEALQYYESQGHDFAQYDNNKDGKVDFMGVIWSGPHGEWSSFWWAFQTSFGDANFKLDGVGLGRYSWQMESQVIPLSGPDTWDGPFNPRMLIHEQGHGLGLPDYYDYDTAVGPTGGLGGMDIMDRRGDNNCFSKWLLDWIEPEIVDTKSLTATLTKNLRDQATNPDALIVMPDAKFDDMTKPFGEFFMVQNRQLTGNDENRPYPGSGLAVWHIDSRLDSNNFNFAFDNSYTEHKLLRLMEADGLEEIEASNNNRVNAGDFYVNGGALGNTTTPNTKKYNGAWTSFGIDNISTSAATMTFDITTTPRDTTAPTGAPTKPTVTIDQDQVTIAWTQGTAADPDPGGITSYELQVGSTAGGNDIFAGSFLATTTRTLSDYGVHDGKEFYARVRALNTAELASAWSPDSDADVRMALPLAPLGETLENHDLTFKAVGDWHTDPDFHVAGASSAQGSCGFNGRTTLQTSLTGPGILRFWWKGSSEKDYDFCSFKVDGKVVNAETDRMSGENEWTLKSADIPAGRHVVAWRYEQDSNTTGRLNGLWVDDVQYQAKPEVDAASGMDVLDLAAFAWAYSSNNTGVDNWLPACDLNGNWTVDDADISMFLTAAGF